jgi:hypothetical protein
LSTEDEESVSLSETLLVNSESLSDKTYFFDLPFLRDLRFEILNDTELHELLESLAGNDFRIFLFFFSFLTLIDSSDKLESEELSLLDCELKSEDTLNCVFLERKKKGKVTERKARRLKRTYQKSSQRKVSLIYMI